MRIFNQQNGKTVATIIATNSMTLDDAIRLVGGTIHEEANGFDENVEIRGKWYCYDDLNMDFADENRYKVREAYMERWYWNVEPDVVEDVQSNGMDLEEIERLAEGWGVTVNELLEQVESI